mgnify:FL=1
MARRVNVLVTGIPRAGTTLVGALLDSLPNTVCLSEPPWHWHKSSGGKLDIGPDPTGEIFAKWLVGDFVTLRRKLVAGEPVQDRRSDNNQSLTNYYAARSSLEQSEHSAVHLKEFSAASLNEDFTLAIKHNGPYLSALGPLVELDFFTIIGLVRHPVDVINSWRALNLPVSRGKMHDAARCWPEMARATDNGEVLQRQGMIYDLICERLYSYRDRVSVLRYEDVVSDPACLARAVGSPSQPATELIGKPSRSVSEQEFALISDALLKYGRHYRLFYPEP